ncbi:DUF6220 domain-containing protein [Glycomyces sp. L485]|uniref:DUF6220 domain-containing protein n=1 Tax=Glycomyces sp. L485 TaxID=2909235 RepID=UPI001F4B35D7|nr:DUF6220 domain-containing protein [Glycomyces sp. L485]MCH7229561.1 DUF6220 domain-containing protein [Glycomyces sp. L485]
MLEFFRIWTGVLGALIALQFFLAGYGAIATGDTAEAFELHIMNGRLIGAVSLLGILFAVLARSGSKLVGLAAAVFGLVALQSVIALVSVGGTVPGQILFGLHAVNAVFIMSVAGRADKTAKRLLEDRRISAGDASPEAATA